MVGRFCCKDLLSFQKRLGRHSAWQEHVCEVRDRQGAFQAMDTLNLDATLLRTSTTARSRHAKIVCNAQPSRRPAEMILVGNLNPFIVPLYNM
jgi:hypothetical protein